MAAPMNSSFQLKDKLSQVRHLLNDANKRLQEEATKYEVFATKTSAIVAPQSAATAAQNGHQNTGPLPPVDLIRTMSDISALKSVLSCPIFNRIVNVTDSLDQLSYQLNIHPSIGPTDIDIDSNGELILAPTIDPNPIHNFSGDTNFDYNDHAPQRLADLTNIPQANGPTQVNTQSSFVKPANNCLGPQNVADITNTEDISQNSQNVARVSNNGFGAEKLVSTRTVNNRTYAVCSRQSSADNNGVAQQMIPPYVTSNGHQPSAVLFQQSYLSGPQFVPIANVTQENSTNDHNDNGRDGYSNELYKNTYPSNQTETVISGERQHQPSSQGGSFNRQQHGADFVNSGTRNGQNGKSNLAQFGRGSCSPSTSAGSTVRLADECDSGASSFLSQVKGTSTPYSPQPYTKPLERITRDGPSSLTSPSEERGADEDPIDHLLDDIEKVKVTLEKDNNGLGITVGGYVCAEECISGIFIKSIAPDGPAARSGRVKILDQISAVNGKKILEYSNSEAMNIIRNTGRIVTLELMRTVAEKKYRRLENSLKNAQLSTQTNPPKTEALSQGLTNVAISSNKSAIPVSRLPRSASQSPTKSAKPAPIIGRTTVVQVSSNQSGVADMTGKEPLVSNNGAAKTNAPGLSLQETKVQLPSQIPQAAQRGTANRIIETKQGARNTIDIRSPGYQTTNPIPGAVTANPQPKNRYESGSGDLVGSRDGSDELGRLVALEEPQWEKDVEIVGLQKDPSQGLGFTVKEYSKPTNPSQSIIMITSLTPGGIAESSGRLAIGDLLIFVDDIELEGKSLAETVNILKRAVRQVTLGVLRLKRNVTA